MLEIVFVGGHGLKLTGFTYEDVSAALSLGIEKGRAVSLTAKSVKITINPAHVLYVEEKK